MVAVAITRTDLTAMKLRGAAARSRDAQAARRMLELALVVDGIDRTTAAETCGMDRQTLRDWVHRYNADGLAGLSNRKAPARSRRLDAARLPILQAGLRPAPIRRRTGRALAAQGPSAADRGKVRGGIARAHRGSSLWASIWQCSAIVVCLCARSTRSPIPRRRPFSKRVPRDGSRRSPGGRPGQTALNLVPG